MGHVETGVDSIGCRRRGRRGPQGDRRSRWLLRPSDRAVTVDVRVDGDVATVTFSSGPLNLYSLELHEEFDAALDRVEAQSPRVVVVRAEGKIVSGGVDVAQFHARTSKQATRELYDRMIELPDRFAA